MKIDHDKIEAVKVKTKDIVSDAIKHPFRTALLIGVTGSAIAKVIKSIKR